MWLHFVSFYLLDRTQYTPNYFHTPMLLINPLIGFKPEPTLSTTPTVQQHLCFHRC